MRYLYLHGFASSAESRKGRHLAEVLARRGLSVERLDLNVPSFARLSPRLALEVVGRAAGAEPVTLLGSSMGGWLAAVWAAEHPEQVARLVLLCPGFDLSSRWPALLGQRAFLDWQRDGTRSFEDARGVSTDLHWAFVEEARGLPAWPVVACPTLVLHGCDDEVVPLASSERWVASAADRRLVVLEDDHALLGSLDRIADEVVAFLDR